MNTLVTKTRRPLDNEALAAYAPSVFADAPSADVSDRYSFIPTHRIVDRLREAGWTPVNAREERVRLDEHRGFQKHVIRYQRFDMGQMTKVGDSTFELVQTNSHNRTSGLSLSAGLFRLVCLNGMCVSEGTVGEVKLRHTGLLLDEVIDASLSIADRVPMLAETVHNWKAHRLSEVESRAFAVAAITLRWDDPTKAAATPESLLRPQRSEDAGNDLWSTFNRVQENLISGQRLRWSEQHDVGNRRVRKVRAITSINEDSRLNKSLWTLAEALRNGGTLPKALA